MRGPVIFHATPFPRGLAIRAVYVRRCNASFADSQRREGQDIHKKWKN